MNGPLRVILGALALSCLVADSILSSDETPRGESLSSTSVVLPVRSRVHDLEGRQHILLESSGDRGVALVFLAADCPVSDEALPRLNKLAVTFQKQNVEMFGVISGQSITRQQAREHYSKFRLKFPVILDSANNLRKLTGATHSPQAFVFDRRGQEIYRGLIDDSSDRAGKKASPRKNFLADALQAAAGGHRLPVSRTQPIGCQLEEASTEDSSNAVTFNRDIAPIIFSNCVACHRDGEVAPFGLTTFKEVSKRARQIAEVVSSRLMPPWKPAPDYGHFSNERRLSDSQISLIQAWHEADAPEGDSADLPALPKFPTGWQLGKPDMIVRMPRRFALAADGPDLYQHFVIPLGLNQDRLIRAIEVHPGNPKVVHHAHMFLDNTGEARILDEADPAEGYTRFGGHGLSSAAYLGGWNPGATPHFFPKGTGRLLPKGGDVVFQIHYHPSGKPEFDQTEIGIYFAPPDAQQLIADLIVGNTDLLIPAGVAEARFTAEYTTPSNLLLMEIRPHMHLLGKSYQVRGVLPTGQEVPLIKIEDWDFNWQDSYVFDPIVLLPAGTKIQIEIVYDNSSKNPANPNSPPRTVYFGEESTDEMSNCALRVTTETLMEFQQVVSDNGKYWSAQMKKYLDRNMTPDKKLREKPATKNTRSRS